MTLLRRVPFLFLLLVSMAHRAAAADQWIEVRSPHFVVVSNDSEGATRTVNWQLEQIRSAIGMLWPWAKLDLNKPLAVLAVKDEPSMKALVPEYWERRNAVHPATVWVGGVDQTYLAMRSDLEGQDDATTNPYLTSYFSYVSMILQQSLPRRLPVWLERGLAGVMSNTLVRQNRILVGAPIPWKLERLRTGTRQTIPALLKVAPNSNLLRDSEFLQSFDAESYAFVHYLMFGEGGVRTAKLDRFMQMIANGTASDAAFREALGPPEDLDGPFAVYISRSLFSYKQFNLDAAVKKQGFTSRALSPAEAAGCRAHLHAAMRRPVEARAAIAEARKAGDVPEALVVDGILLDAENKDHEAQQAFSRAVDAKTTNPYAYYRLASLLWSGPVDREALTRIEQLLTQAIGLNTRFAEAYAMVGDARSALGTGDPMAMILRAISLQPAEPHFHLTAATVLMRDKRLDEALKHAEMAAALSDTDEERRRASDAIDRIGRAKGGAPAPARREF